MRLAGGGLILSATDLSNFLSCRHRTALEMAEAHGKHRRPRWDDPLLEILFQRGLEHEKAYVESLRARGRDIVDLAGVKDLDAAVGRTLDAMRSGAEVMVQAALCDGRWYGRPDVIQRVDKASGLGGWSYEVADTKLARETRAGTILQLGLYSEMLGAAQGVRPECFQVVTPDPDVPVHSYRTDDYAAYVRWIRTQMEGVVVQEDGVVAAAHYPEPVELCDVCPWSAGCNKKRHDDDHMSIVAGISRTQRRELESQGLSTLTGLAHLPVPLAFRPERGAVETYVRVREQARVQFESRGKALPVHELRPFEGGKGLSRLAWISTEGSLPNIGRCKGTQMVKRSARPFHHGTVTV